MFRALLIFKSKGVISAMNNDISLEELLNLFLKRIWFIIAFSILTAVLGFLISNYLISPQYISSTSLYVQGTETQDQNNSRQALTDLQYRERIINTYIVILENEDFLARVAEQDNLDYSATEIKQMISLKGIPNTEVFEIKVKNTDPLHAKIIAQKLAELAPEEISRVVNSGKVEVISTAKVPTVPTSPNVIKNTVISMLLGFVISLLLAYILSLFDTTVKTSEELTNRYDLPVLGNIPGFDIKYRGAK